MPRKESRYIITPQKRGQSDVFTHPGLGEGYIDFDSPPQQADDIGTKRYAFRTLDGGLWHIPIEREYQGGRWEDAHHAAGDWERYQQMPDEEARMKMFAMWGYGPLAHDLGTMLEDNVSFDDMRKRVSKHNTWRFISGGEPGI